MGAESLGVLLGEAVRWARKARQPRLTQADLSEATGVPEGTIASLEAGKSHNPREHVADPLVSFFGFKTAEEMVAAYRRPLRRGALGAGCA